MPDELKPKSLSEAMDAAWNDTMGETSVIPDQNHHIAVEAPSETPAPEAPAPKPDALTTGTEPSQEQVSPTPASTEDSSVPQTLEPPQHWSETDRTMFGTLGDEAKSFLLRRHRDMEADYTRKTQENSAAVKIGTAIKDDLDPSIRGQLASNNISDEQFVKNLIAFHRYSIADPVGFIKTAMTNLRLDPAKVFGTEPKPGEPTPPADPVNERLANIESFLTHNQEEQRRQATDRAKSELKVFAEEKDSAGTALHPHFEAVKQIMGRLMAADQEMDLATAYDVAVYRDPELRKTLTSVTPTAVTPAAVDMDKIKRGEEAARAAKANRRGSGNGAAPAAAVPQGKMSLQDALNKAADEVGLNDG
jgi:hypothetical protein